MFKCKIYTMVALADVVNRVLLQLQGVTEEHDESFCATTIKAMNKMKHSTVNTRMTIFQSKGNAQAPPNLTKTERRIILTNNEKKVNILIEFQQEAFQALKFQGFQGFPSVCIIKISGFFRQCSTNKIYSKHTYIYNTVSGKLFSPPSPP